MSVAILAPVSTSVASRHSTVLWAAQPRPHLPRSFLKRDDAEVGEEAWDDVTGATAHSYGPTGDDTFFYTNSSLMDGVMIGLDYIPSDGADQIESSTAAVIKYTGIDGLTIGAGMGEDNGEGPSDADDVTAFNVTYAMDAISVGYSSYEVDSNAASSDTTLTAMGISYAVSDDLSVSSNTNRCFSKA